jgi:selenocysteine lyase/cysteine desulfurase
MRDDLFALKSKYFNSAYMGPMPLPAKAAIENYVRLAVDPVDLTHTFDLDDEVRDALAKLLQVAPSTVAISTSVSELVSHVANGLELQPDDEVVLMQGDYPSLVLPWMVAHERRRFKLRFLPREDFFSPARFRQALNPRTRFAACSHVMFNTGLRLPVAELAKVARENDVLFLSDISQSFGGMDLDSGLRENVDILVGVAYKWLLGPYGSAFATFSGRALERVQRTHASWLHTPGAKARENLLNYTTATRSGARRFDRGETAAFLNCVALKASLEMLAEIGLAQIEKHNAELTQYFLDHLPKNIPVTGSRQAQSNIVCLQPADPMEAKARLAKKKIDVSVREGSLRASFHLFNTRAQVDEFLLEL